MKLGNLSLEKIISDVKLYLSLDTCIICFKNAKLGMVLWGCFKINTGMDKHHTLYFSWQSK